MTDWERLLLVATPKASIWPPGFADCGATSSSATTISTAAASLRFPSVTPKPWASSTMLQRSAASVGGTLVAPNSWSNDNNSAGSSRVGWPKHRPRSLVGSSTSYGGCSDRNNNPTSHSGDDEMGNHHLNIHVTGSSACGEYHCRRQHSGMKENVNVNRLERQEREINEGERRDNIATQPREDREARGDGRIAVENPKNEEEMSSTGAPIEFVYDSKEQQAKRVSVHGDSSGGGVDVACVCKESGEGSEQRVDRSAATEYVNIVGRPGIASSSIVDPPAVPPPPCSNDDRDNEPLTTGPNGAPAARRTLTSHPNHSLGRSCSLPTLVVGDRSSTTHANTTWGDGTGSKQRESAETQNVCGGSNNVRKSQLQEVKTGLRLLIDSGYLERVRREEDRGGIETTWRALSSGFVPDASGGFVPATAAKDANIKAFHNFVYRRRGRAKLDKWLTSSLSPNNNNSSNNITASQRDPESSIDRPSKGIHNTGLGREALQQPAGGRGVVVGRWTSSSSSRHAPYGSISGCFPRTPIGKPTTSSCCGGKAMSILCQRCGSPNVRIFATPTRCSSGNLEGGKGWGRKKGSGGEGSGHPRCHPIIRHPFTKLTQNENPVSVDIRPHQNGVLGKGPVVASPRESQGKGIGGGVAVDAGGDVRGGGAGGRDIASSSQSARAVGSHSNSSSSWNKGWRYRDRREDGGSTAVGVGSVGVASHNKVSVENMLGDSMLVPPRRSQPLLLAPSSPLPANG